MLSLTDVTLAAILSLVDGPKPADFVLNVPKTGRFMGEAIGRLQDDGIGWGGLADAMRALRDCDVLGEYEEREFDFVTRGLRQHRQVSSVEMIDDHRIRVKRALLPDVVVFIGAMYQPTARSVRDAIDRYGAFDIFAATNPNSVPTLEAVQAGQDAGVRVLKWRAVLATLNH